MLKKCKIISHIWTVEKSSIFYRPDLNRSPARDLRLEFTFPDLSEGLKNEEGKSLLNFCTVRSENAIFSLEAELDQK